MGDMPFPPGLRNLTTKVLWLELLYWIPFLEKQEQSIIAPMVMFLKAKHQKMISKNHLMPFNKKRCRLHALAGIASSCVLLVFLLGATEINIGANNLNIHNILVMFL